jgi:hypothetical protein
MSGLKINLSKSEIVVMGSTAMEQERVALLLICRLGKFPIMYLGLPVSDKTLRASDWEFLTAKVGRRVDPWQGTFLGDLPGFNCTDGADKLLSVKPIDVCLEPVYAL